MNDSHEQGTYALYVSAHDLHLRGGHAADAEAMYRTAIAAGFTDAGYNLGILLRDLGRDDEAEATLQAAASSDRPEVASRAALAAARLRDRGHGDLAGARRFYAMAFDRGDGAVREEAGASLALWYAAQGRRRAAAAIIEVLVRDRYGRKGVKAITEDSGRRFAVVLARILAWPPANAFVRRGRGACYRRQVQAGRGRLAGLNAALPARTE
jgi:tetratricopeptide (TPR) repeat protein